jgi:putative FmdB family regulatory protein
MPIYEFSCPKCRVIFNFFSKRVNPDRSPVCPKCGNKKMEKEISSFATLKGAKDPASAPGPDSAPDLDDPKMMRAMSEIERDIGNLDENDPRQMARLMRKMKEALPPGTMPKDLDVAIKRLEQGEDPEKIEADMGDILGGDEDMGDEAGPGGLAGAGYSRDANLYDY